MRFKAHRDVQRCLALACTSGLLWFSVSCEPNVVVGSWSCPKPDSVGDGGEGSVTPIASPWSTSFEDGFCAYTRAGGLCYESNGDFEAVSSPVHSGKSAAAFTANPGDGGQSRCLVSGALPVEAYYGAWYFIPSVPSALDNWNLLHFRGGNTPGTAEQGIWDVTVKEAPDGSLRLAVLDFLNNTWHYAEGVPRVPIGSWFHIQFHLRRSATTAGAFTLYQDGARAASADGIVTDIYSYGEWFVGNLFYTLPAPASTVYVDDVTIQSEL